MWISKETPDRMGQGGQRRQFFQIQALTRAGIAVHVLAPRGTQDDTSLRDIAEVVRFGPRRHTRQLSGVRRRGPRLPSRAMRSAEYSAVVVAHAESWDLVAREVGQSSPPVLVDFHNVLSRWYERIGDADLLRHWIQVERDILARSNAISVCAGTELLALQPATDMPALVLPHGVDPGEWVQTPSPNPAPVLAMFGSWWWLPNQLGLRWMLEDVWPEVRRAVPRAELHLAGSSLSPELTCAPGVRVVGRVRDLAQFLGDASAIALPMRQSAGTPVKFVEAMASGVPVIATTDAAQAISDPPAFVSDHREAWITTAIELLLNPGDGRLLGAQARDLALSTLTWDQTSQPLVKWVQRAAQARVTLQSEHRHS